jgi:dCTP deaminase
MVANGSLLTEIKPLKPMFDTKQKGDLVSFGMSEAGYDIRIKQDVVLHPFKRFTLASSVERFQMPRHLMAIVHDKSSWARRGLSVFNTVIEPGWEGWLTLELVYHGWKPLRIPALSGIAQVIFHELVVWQEYTGRYQNQEDKPIAAISMKEADE